MTPNPNEPTPTEYAITFKSDPTDARKYVYFMTAFSPESAWNNFVRSYSRRFEILPTFVKIETRESYAESSR